jgi:alpha-galactosidase
MERQYSKEQEQVKTWMEAHFAVGALPPFSFTYGGKSSSEFLSHWQFSQETKQLDNARTEHLFTYTDPQTGLQVCCICEVFADFPAVEWVVKFFNNGADDTPIIENVQSLDTILTRKEDGEFVLHRALGSSAAKMDFAPVDEVMRPNAKIQLAPVGGRSSNTHVFPFFNIESSGKGVMVGIGWSGQWAAELLRDGGTSLRVRAGMELTHLKLHPGEGIRTPRILLLFWQGKECLHGHNLLRRFILRHHTLQKGGKPVTVPLACMDRRYGGEEANRATEENQIEFGRRYAQCGVEYLWIDAGWFEGRWPNGVGNWFIRKDGFPDGLRPVSDAVKNLGMGLVIWFEPERVHKDTWLDREHPDWILRLPGNPNGLLNLGNPQARRWLTEHISGMIGREGISVYRQDFNMEPLPYWRATDEPDRQGMTEIRHIEGLYAFWDELLARHSDLIIDNCASGGRRIDLETASRSIPLWRTDYNYGESNGQQSHTLGLSFYLPTGSTGCLHPNTYSFRSAMNGGVCLCPTYDWNEADLEQVRRLVDEFKRVRAFFYGDFYPLTAHSIRNDVWIAYQFHREDMKQGMFLAFRRPESPYLSARLKLGGLRPEANYVLTFEDTNVKLSISEIPIKTGQTFTGEELANGIDVTIEDAPGSLLVIYRQLI